ncbi:hypothetical protein BJ170DRAFT_147801 [Xylariales sp. AK1849]|nr:hypothetical protein BJ170DRAFT_147801 [Xylariales sp. AK1849]
MASLKFAGLLAALFVGQAVGQCVPTDDARQCTLAVFGTAWRESDTDYCTWKKARIYDNACNTIGEMDKPQDESGFSINSQLKWTVDIRDLYPGGNYNNFGMCYGAYCFQSDFDCFVSKPNTNDLPNVNAQETQNTCKHVFPCRD